MIIKSTKTTPLVECSEEEFEEVRETFERVMDELVKDDE